MGGRSIRCQGLQSETGKQSDSEITNEVVELPTEVGAGRPFFWPEGSDHKQDHDGHATGFCDSTKTMGAGDNRPQREVIVLIAMRTQNGPLECCSGVQS